jgi:flagellar motor switch protein FliM
MSELLSEDELSALSEGVADGSIPVDTGFNTRTKVRKHDLASEDSTLGVNLGSVEMINERFIRLFRLGLVEVLRSTPKINPNKVEIVKYGDYLKGKTAPLAVNMIHLKPLRGHSLIVIDPKIIFAALDVFFGGFGSNSNNQQTGVLAPTRLFTPTEDRIIKIIIDIFFNSLKEAWAPLINLNIEIASSEINPQFAQIADENDLVILCRFDVEDGSQRSAIDLVYPYATLKPIRDLLRNRVATGDGNELSDREWANDLKDSVAESQIELQVILGKLEITLHNLKNASVGDILYFKKNNTARVDICNIPVFTSELGVVNSQVAIKILDSLNILGLPEEERNGR